MKLTARECRILAAALGDKPTTVIPVARLIQGRCASYASGPLTKPLAALIVSDYAPEEPFAYGSDAGAVWSLLKAVDGWACVDSPAQLAEPLGRLIEAEDGAPVQYYADLYHALLKPVERHFNRYARLLTLSDALLIKSAPAEVQGDGYKSTEAMLTDGVAAGAVVEGRIVAIAHTYAETERHADIGVSTLEPWRGRGFATAAASLAAQKIQARGKTPVWSCGADNAASLRVAQKLGFEEVDQRTYVIPASRR